MIAPTPCSVRDGFSLPEVMVSSAVLLGLMVLLLGAAESGTRFWNRAEKRRAVLREAGAALHLVDRDLCSAVRTDDPESFATEGGADSDSLFFLVSHPEDHRPGESPGDLCVTGYYTASAPGRPEERNLYRFHASGTDVAGHVREHRLDELYAGAGPGKPGNELLARHVASFAVRPASPAVPDTLLVSVVTVDPTVEKRLASRTSAERQAILRKDGVRLSAVITLPPRRDSFPKP